MTVFQPLSVTENHQRKGRCAGVDQDRAGLGTDRVVIVVAVESNNRVQRLDSSRVDWFIGNRRDMARRRR